MTMTKADLVDHVRSALWPSKTDCADVLEHVVDAIMDALERGEEVKLPGFGVFTVREKKARIGRNPRTGQSIALAARRVVVFKASPILKKALRAPAPGTPVVEQVTPARRP